MQVFQRIAKPFRSLSARRAWIEMLLILPAVPFRTVALRKESVDRNALPRRLRHSVNRSLSARRAWIEIAIISTWKPQTTVALRKESVDRNTGYMLPSASISTSLSARRAWIEIGPSTAKRATPASLSARRAWIEMQSKATTICALWVALRKESVDRNVVGSTVSVGDKGSLSARRAWIEISRWRRQALPISRRSPQGERG